jgi:hypothetical protein
MTHFGFKQAWIAAAADDPERLAEALDLDVEGDDADEVLVVGPFDGWVLCAGECLGEHTRTADRLTRALCDALGAEVQYFATHRVSEVHAWARARTDGSTRAFSWVGERGEVELDVGSISAEEHEIGLVPAENGALERDGQAIDEEDVVALAARWSVDPLTVDAREWPSPGVTRYVRRRRPVPSTQGVARRKARVQRRIEGSAFSVDDSKPWWKFW